MPLCGEVSCSKVSLTMDADVKAVMEKKLGQHAARRLAETDCSGCPLWQRPTDCLAEREQKLFLSSNERGVVQNELYWEKKFLCGWGYPHFWRNEWGDKCYSADWGSWQCPVGCTKHTGATECTRDGTSAACWSFANSKCEQTSESACVKYTGDCWWDDDKIRDIFPCTPGGMSAQDGQVLLANCMNQGNTEEQCCSRRNAWWCNTDDRPWCNSCGCFSQNRCESETACRFCSKVVTQDGKIDGYCINNSPLFDCPTR